MKARPSSAPIAFLSDVHGNLPALEAVLGELEHRGIKDICVAGDLLLGGEQPVEVYKRLQQVGARCVRGISDSALATVPAQRLSPKDDAQQRAAARFLATRDALGELVIRFLQKLPDRLRIPLIDGREILMVHGSPADPSVELEHSMEDDEMLALIADDPADIVICGASHVPFQRELPDVRVVNVGSVGASPEGRVAHYTIVTPRMDGTVIEQSTVEY